MTQRTRYNAIGLAGSKGIENNQKDSFIKTYEFDIVIAPSTSAQDTGIPSPSGAVQAISAYLDIKTPEATGLTKTVSVGVIGSSASFLSAEDVSAAGPTGTPVTTAIQGGANFSYVLGSADFAELEARCVLTVVATDA